MHRLGILRINEDRLDKVVGSKSSRHHKRKGESCKQNKMLRRE
jgi:hypothetical protein